MHTSAPTPFILPITKLHARFAKMFWGLSEKLLKDGKVKVHPLSVRPGGLKGVLDGLQEMREGKVSGTKLVYKVSETP